MKSRFDQPEPDDQGRNQFDFSRVGGFRMEKLTDTQKSQLLRRVADWARETLLARLGGQGITPEWVETRGRELESLMKAANQIAAYLENENL